MCTENCAFSSYLQFLLETFLTSTNIYGDSLKIRVEKRLNCLKSCHGNDSYLKWTTFSEYSTHLRHS